MRVVSQGRLAQLPPDARLLVAAERNLVVQHVIRVDPDSAGAQLVGDADGGVEVLGVDGGRETVRAVVARLDGFVLRLELGDRAHGPEDLLLHDLHVLRDVGEDGRLDEVAFVAVTLAADLNLGSCFLAGLDVAHDAVVLQLGDLRSLEGVGAEWVTDLVLEGASLESLDELVVDARLDVDARASTAALAVVEEDTEVDPGDGVLDIGIVEDDIW